ncbi:hypothetical protein IT399_01600 [Candidatus Nomurabacteria bacterium]|nr:hypothetical protein [Candidatus Nomurabacteria bacterium]
MSAQLFLVFKGRERILATPHTGVYEKRGRKQFWFYHQKQALLAIQDKTTKRWIA